MIKALERIKFITGSKINDIISKFEDPVTMVDNAIVDAKIAYAKIKTNGATAIVEEQKAKKAYEDDLKKAEAMHAIAVKAVEAKNEKDAKEALAAEQKYAKSAEAKKVIYDATHVAAEKLRASLEEYTNAIQDMEAKKAEIVAKGAAAKALKEVNKLTEVPTPGADSAFARLQARADAEYESALAENEMNKMAKDLGSKEEKLAKKYDAFNETQSVDDAYKALLAEVGKG